jgi:hypothetical protein
VKANGAFLGKRPETPSFGAVALLGIYFWREDFEAAFVPTQVSAWKKELE